MDRGIGSWLTFSNVIAVIALFVALSGSVYAAVKIDGKSIRKNSIPANRLKKDTVTGKQVREAKLRQVPSAAAALRAVNADKATTAVTAGTATNATTAQEAAHAAQADNATRVNGVSVVKISARLPAGTPATTILDLNGLQLEATCSPAVDLDLLAKTTKPESSIYMHGTQTDTASPADDFGFDLEGGDFLPETPVNVSNQLGGGGSFPIIGSIAYDNPDGSEVMVDFVMDINGGGGESSRCVVAGNAIGE